MSWKLAVKALKIRACLCFLNFTIINKALVSGLGGWAGAGAGQTVVELLVHNGQLRTNSCENGRLVTLQVNHLISDNLLSQFLCCEGRREDCVCLEFARVSHHQSSKHSLTSPSCPLMFYCFIETVHSAEVDSVT